MAAQLADVGETVSNVTMIAKVLASLSPKFAAFQTAWDIVDSDRQTMENLQEKLIREESRMTSSEDIAGAFSALRRDYKSERGESSDAKPKKKPFGKPRDHENVECYKCKQKGHYARECKSKGKPKAKWDNNESRESRD